MAELLGRCATALVAVASLAGTASAQLRVATWNISNYGGGREAEIKTAVYSSFQGRTFQPDVLMVLEVTSLTGASNLLTYLNTAPGSPGDWSRFTFVNGPDTDGAVYFRTSKLVPVVPAPVGDPDGFPESVLVEPGGNINGAPRDVRRYDVRLAGYSASSTVISLYPVHMKAGSATTDQTRRQYEATMIRANMTALPSGWNFLVAGDFNIQSSNQAAYQTMTVTPGAGQVFDPISTPGSWNNNGMFRYVHTQDPAGAGGMDDRHDQILISGGMLNGTGLDYIGAFGVPYSTTTWNDPNHSYRCWGNDGTSFDVAMTIASNAMVGPTIAQALVDLCSGAGHLPVFFDARVPAKAGSDTALDFGDALVGDPDVVRSLSVANAGNTAVWTTAGIETLSYTLAAPPGFTAPAGPFADAAGGGGNAHAVSLSTMDPGDFSGTLTIASNDPDQPARLVTVTGRVWCPTDFDRSGFVDIDDFDAFVHAFEDGVDEADFDHSGFVDFDDFDAFVQAFELGC